MVVFLFSAFKVVKIIENGKREENNFEKLRIHIKSEKEKADNKRDSEEKLNTLFNQNHDFIAWLSIADTPIDYPVMSTPNDPNYYLRRDFHKEYAISGTFFIGDGLTPDSKSFVVYGHNMQNSTMFGTLDNYEDKKYMESHKYIELKTLKEDRRYEVIAAFYTNIETSDFQYFNFCGNPSRDAYEKYINELSKVSLYGKVENITHEDQIMMLSTCSDTSGPERFVVVAKRTIN
ncbi:class B sortase [Clostridium perfringens]